MKLGYLSWLLGAARLASSASPGRVILLERPSSPPIDSPDIVSPRIARLIFAQRLGLSDAFSLDGAEPIEIETVDLYGGPQQYSLTGPAAKGPRALIVVHGIEDAAPFRQNNAHSTVLDIVPAPHPADTKELLDEFEDLAYSATTNRDSGFAGIRGFSELANHPGNGFAAHGDKIVMHIASLKQLSEASGPGSPETRKEAIRIRDLIEELRADDGFATVTLVFMPPESHCNHAVGALKIYGSPQKRSSPKLKRSEVPMSGDGSKPQTQAQASSLQPFASSGSPIPSKFTSLNACQRVTSNCTGHGECKIVAKELSGDRTNEYYGCVCNKPEVRNNKDGSKKTTHFGGAACQKKNVVAPFWLLAGTTIFLISVVTMGIGLLYSMGTEELPSVIGAGVSGPRPK